MSKDNIQIELDKASKANLQKQFELLGTNMENATPAIIAKVLNAIKRTAQNYLKGRGHIVTNRLRLSINVQVYGKNGSRSYTDNTGKSYDAEMKTVNLAKGEGAVGTNVEYAAAVEFGSVPHEINAPVNIKGVGWRYIGMHPGFAGDSYLYRALKSVDVTAKVGDEILNVVKYGKYMNPKTINTHSGRAMTNGD